MHIAQQAHCATETLDLFIYAAAKLIVQARFLFTLYMDIGPAHCAHMPLGPPTCFSGCRHHRCSVAGMKGRVPMQSAFGKRLLRHKQRLHRRLEGTQKSGAESKALTPSPFVNFIYQTKR